MLVLHHIVDRIVTADLLGLIIKSDRSELVVTKVTRREIPEKVDGFQMEQIAVEEVFAEAQNKITDQTCQEDRPDS